MDYKGEEEVGREMTKAELAFESIHNMLSALENQLRFVLTPETPTKAGSVGEKVGATQLGEKLKSLEDRISYLLGRISL